MPARAGTSITDTPAGLVYVCVCVYMLHAVAAIAGATAMGAAIVSKAMDEVTEY